MRKVTKVLLFIYRQAESGPEFFVQDSSEGYTCVLSGKVGDHYPGETLLEAAARETEEELGVKSLKITEIGDTETVELRKWNMISTEHAFLIEIPNVDVHYLPSDEKHTWVKPANLESYLTFDHHKRAAVKAVALLQK